MADQSLLDDVNAADTNFPETYLPPDWDRALRDEWGARGQSSGDVADRANQAARGAFEAQVATEENAEAIDELDGRVSNIEKQFLALSRQLSDLRTRVTDLEDFNENPYGSLVRNVSATISVPASSNSDATFNTQIPGRKVTLGSRITIDEDGVYRLSALARASSSDTVTLIIEHDGTTYLSVTGTAFDDSLPAIDIPMSQGDQVYILWENANLSAVDVTQDFLNLSVSRTGS